MNRFSTLFFRNRHLLVLSIVVLLVAGLGATFNLPRQEDPRIVNRNPLIITNVPGASAERVETLVTDVLEESLNEINEIKKILSTSSAGVSTLSVELKDSITADDNEQLFSEIRDKVGDVLPLLPPEAGDPVIDDKRDPIAFTLILALRWDQAGEPPLGILNRLAEDLADRIRNVSGTEIVRLYGAPAEEITVVASWEDLAELGLTTGDIAQAISAADSKRPAGTLRSTGTDVQMEVEGELDSIARVADIPVANNLSASVLRVGDIAEVKRGWRMPVSEIANVDGKRSILIAVRMEEKQRIDLWAQRANSTVDIFRQEVGEGITVDAIFEQERYTMTKLNDLVGNLLAGVAIVTTVIFIMMGWRLALIIGSALPLVIAMVLFMMQVGGTPIHQMSIFGMIIALGLLIDNAIVVADEVTRRKARGLSALEAVDQAVRHLFLPLLASTLTTILAFAPILLLPGGAGDFVGSIAGSVINALVASFIVAMTITAGLAGLFSKVPSSNQASRFWRNGIRFPRISKVLRGLLRAALVKPMLAILVVLGMSGAGFVAASTLGNSFFPAEDRNMFEVHVWMPKSSSIHNTVHKAKQIETRIRSFPETKRLYWLAGASFPTVYYNLVMDKDRSAHYAHLIVTSGSSDETKSMIPRLQEVLDRDFPGAQIVVRRFNQGPPVVADIEYRIFGPSINELQDIGERLRLVLQAHPDVLHTQTTLPRAEPKLWLKADEDEARIAGFQLNDLATQLQGNLEGFTGGTIIENLEEMPVRVRLAQENREDVDRIASTFFINRQTGDWVPLSAVGRLELRPSLGSITRYKGERTNTVKAYTRAGALPIDVTNEVLRSFESDPDNLPAGYRLEVGGAVEQDQDAKGNLLLYVPVLLTMTVATLVLTFRSVGLALLLGVSAGLSVGFGLFSTWVMQFPISFNTILGCLGLVGLAFNNSIVVLAAIRAEDAARAGEVDAVLEAIVETSRHLISTTLTTIGGFLPLLLLAGGDFWPSLSIVLAGGVGGSMLTALVLVPSVYVLFARFSRQPATAKIKPTLPLNAQPTAEVSL